MMKHNSWEEHISPVPENGSLKQDMRQDAVHIILDYMALFSEGNEMKASELPKTGAKSKWPLYAGGITISAICLLVVSVMLRRRKDKK